jgi:hypothetical protein
VRLFPKRFYGPPIAAFMLTSVQGTCLVRPGSEAGGIVVSLRPDDARLPGALCWPLPRLRGAAGSPDIR